MVIMAVMLMEQIIVTVKQPIKEHQTEPQVEWRWDSMRSVWLQWNKKSKIWVYNHKPLPQWFIESGGVIPASLLLRLWKDAASFVELHKHVFWLPKSELQQLLDHLATECQRHGVEPPVPLPLGDMGLDIPISEWLDQGLVVPMEHTDASLILDESESTYDPMQALFEAQKKRSDQGLPESRPFFQTVEQGKFTAKH